MPLSAGDEIRAAIAAAGGQLRFDEFMARALYGEGGFYSTVGMAGRRGDFITSPEVGPLFGAVIARWLDSVWEELGEPDEFTVIEAGAGPGTLARAIRHAAPACSGSLTYVAVELSAAQRDLHPDWVLSVASMPTGSVTGVVIANELLDNLPFRLFVMDGGWREAYVVEQRDATFAEILRPAADLASLGLPDVAPHGSRVPVQQQAGEWLQSARGVLECGRVLIIDYAATSDELSRRPWREWLRTYRGHERGEHYLRHPGAQDITAEVALDQLFASAGQPGVVRSQQQFLQRWGIDGLVDEGRRIWNDNAARPTLAAMAMRSRVVEAEALCDPNGLGAFTVVEFEV